MQRINTTHRTKVAKTTKQPAMHGKLRRTKKAQTTFFLVLLRYIYIYKLGLGTPAVAGTPAHQRQKGPYMVPKVSRFDSQCPLHRISTTDWIWSSHRIRFNFCDIQRVSLSHFYNRSRLVSRRNIYKLRIFNYILYLFIYTNLC